MNPDWFGSIAAQPGARPRDLRGASFQNHVREQGMKTAMKVMVLALLAFLMSACATQQIGRDFDETQLGTFKPHETTMAQVIAALGQPVEKEASDQGVRLHYQWIKSGVSPASLIPFVHTTDQTDAKDAFLYFDKEGKYLRAETNETHDHA